MLGRTCIAVIPYYQMPGSWQALRRSMKSLKVLFARTCKPCLSPFSHVFRQNRHDAFGRLAIP